ncbi:peptidoglycan recognition protein family protein [Acidaminococcus massiliensis]|uniref:peptidoglycan recognition protein family protein n=1 Tax=Acidaminococcus massiliensis TaxID=1852375 RepID=UPI0026DC8F3E|nr:N-acetylmuramoyl-L-alanine amidase [Acidaminococcus massiliensis]
MEEIKRQDVLELARRARGRIQKIYLHWTAGRYDQLFPEYHLLIRGDGSLVTSTRDWTRALPHTWNRNTGALGIALCCAKDAVLYGDGTFDLGDYPPTSLQVESTSILLAALSDVWKLPLEPAHVMTHAEAADLDGYGPSMAGTPAFERWDLWKLKDYDGVWRSGGAVLRGKGLYYQWLAKQRRQPPPPYTL